MSRKTTRKRSESDTREGSSQHASKIEAQPPLEAKLWSAADKLRGYMDATEFKNIVLAIIFLRYASEAFEEHRASLAQAPGGAPENPNQYYAAGIFWIPEEARWHGPRGIRPQGRSSTTINAIENAMRMIERENPTLRGVLPTDLNRQTPNEYRIAELIDLVSAIGGNEPSSQNRAILGRVYEYFLARFAMGGSYEFATPPTLARLMVEIVQPFRGRVYDPCCGSGALLIAAQEFAENHGDAKLLLYGQEVNLTAWRLARMNLAIHQVDANLGHAPADIFQKDLHPGLKADFVLTNPPFNMAYPGGKLPYNDERWIYRVPSSRNTNFAWIQHVIYHLAPKGSAALILPMNTLSSSSSIEKEIRQRIVEDGLVECIVALPPQLFSGTGIPVCLWLLTGRQARAHNRGGRADRVLLIDSSDAGRMTSRGRRELTEQDIQKIASAYTAWKVSNEKFQENPEFCAPASLQQLAANEFNLNPVQYVQRRDVKSPDNETRQISLSWDIGYISLLEDLKSRIQTAQLRANLSVNSELVLLYWEIGAQILRSQQREGWGSKVVDRLAQDLRLAFPAIEGFSPRNLKYMRAFAAAWPEDQFVQEVLAQLTWYHNIALIEKVKDPIQRKFYIQAAISYGWSRAVLVHQIESDLYSRQGMSINNFNRVLPPAQSDLARDTLKDPYIFDFLALGPEARERDLERALLGQIQNFLLEMGAGFALVGNQYHLQVANKDFYLDLLFYHLKLRCFIVVDLKIGEFQPEFAGKMNFYLAAVDDLVRHPSDNGSIGLILCKTQDRVIVEYALRDLQKPIGVAKYRMMSTELKENLPSPEDLAKELGKLEP